jgi:hypothetical protein
MVMSRIAAEREVNTNRPILWPYDVGGTVEVYHAGRNHPHSHSLLALITYTVALLPCYGASHDDIKRQGPNILTSTGCIDSFHRRSQRYLDCIPSHR